MSIETEIIEWALQRAGWQQDVLVALAQGDPFDEAQISALTDEILGGKNNSPSQEAKSISLRSAVADQVTLAAVSDLHGVNALVDDQRLEFASTGITVVYGDNGSGKSGYARLIKALVASRHRPEILANVYEDHAVSPSAAIHYIVDRDARQTEFPSTPVPELLKISFYDEHCGDDYLARESTITYRPSALLLLDGLITVCDAIRSELTKRINENESQAANFTIDAITPAGRFTSSLRAATTDADIDRATTLAPDAHELLAAALAEEARLAGSDARTEKSRLTALAGHARTMAIELTCLRDAVDDRALVELRRLQTVATTARETATLAASADFDDTYLKGVGSDSWRALWLAARNYSTERAYPDNEYPMTGDDSHCVLCQQTLDDGAKERFQQFDAFMTDTTERDAQNAERDLSTAIGTVRTLRFSDSGHSTAIAALTTHDTATGIAVHAELQALETRRDQLVEHIASGRPSPDPLTLAEVTTALTSMSNDLSAKSEATDVASFESALAVAASARCELQAASQLAHAKADLVKEVARLRELAGLRAARSLADTNAITQRTTSLARDYATAHILDQFTRETERLNLQRVTLHDRGGRKGQLNQFPGLLGAPRGTDATTVLSEGEQTALGLAGFFTEAHFDASKSAVIFDDPVTSLDHVRRDKVAKRLAELAVDRQVVVFTHDIAFVGNLVVSAKEAGVGLAERSVERQGLRPGICVQTFPWKAKDFASRLDHLRTELGKLARDRAGLIQDEWEGRVAAWAGYLSETWERCVTSEVLNQVFDRGTSEVRVAKFRLFAAITAEDNEDFQTGYGATSKWSRRHDKSLETNYVAPELKELEHEFTRITSWQKRVHKYL